MFRKLKNKYYNFLNFYNGKINFDFDKKPKRWELINKIIEIKKYSNYLEIGCHNDECFSKILINEKKGVDPIKGGTIRKTSDEFFKKNEEKFDIIFIDGLHEYSQIKRDILNSIKCLNKGGVIMCHDSLPTKYSDQTIPYTFGTWNGDVWKAIVEYRTFENLDICVCTIDHGVSIIKVRQNENLIKPDVSNFKDLNYKYYFKNYTQLMNTKSFDNCLNFVMDK